jgi:sulfoxide reductase heme-binding subunit YedZ
VHYFWLAKASALLWPLAYSAAVALLLGWRIRERRAIPVPKFQSAKPLKFFRQKPD